MTFSFVEQNKIYFEECFSICLLRKLQWGPSVVNNPKFLKIGPCFP